MFSEVSYLTYSLNIGSKGGVNPLRGLRWPGRGNTQPLPKVGVILKVDFDGKEGVVIGARKCVNQDAARGRIHANPFTNPNIEVTSSPFFFGRDDVGSPMFQYHK